MATFTISVETDEMARSIDHLSSGLDVVGRTLQSTSESIVDAERQASVRVATTLSRGFYGMIRSQILQKKAKLQSDIHAKTALLIQEAGAAEAMRETMFRDYTMIKARYKKIATSLDRELQERVSALDAQAFTLVSRDFEGQILRRLLRNAGFPVAQSELSRSSRVLTAGRVKRNILGLCASVAGYIRDHAAVRAAVSRVLRDIQIKAGDPGTVCAPFIQIRKDDGLTTSIGLDTACDASPVPAHAQAVSTAINESIIGGAANPMDEKGTALRVAERFTALCSASGLDERTAKTAQALFSRSFGFDSGETS